MRAHLSLAVRGLFRRPLYLLAAVFSVTLATGVTMAVATVSYELLWRPLPYPEPERLVSLREVDPEGRDTGVSLRNLSDFRERARHLSAMAAFAPRTFGLRQRSGRAVVTEIGQVSADLFETLGVAAARGRLFTRVEDLDEAAVIVLGHDLWTSRFGARADVVGTTVLLNEKPLSVIGILPEGFRFPMGRHGRSRWPEAFIPLPRRAHADKRAVRTLGAIARLSPEATFDSAASELTGLADALAESFPDTNAGYGVRLVPIESALRAANERPMLFLGAAGLLLFSIAAVNLAGLTLARLAHRGGEMGVHLALGARQKHLFGMFFAEAGCVGVLGAIGGLFINHWMLVGLELWLPVLSDSSGVASGPTHQVGTFLGVTAAAGLTVVVSAVAAWLARRSSTHALVAATTFSKAPFSRLRFAVVTSQIALALALSQSAFVLGASFHRLTSVDPGFDREQTLSFGIGLPEARYRGGAALLGFHSRLIRDLSAIRGVTGVGAGSGPLLSGSLFARIGIRRDDDPSRPVLEWSRASVRLASPGYFDAVGIPLLRGRAFSSRDGIDAPRVVLVNDAFASRFYPSRNALGQRLELSWRTPTHPEGTRFEIVGIVAGARQISLREDPVPEVILPFTQFPDETEGATYAIRTMRDDAGLPIEVQDTIDAIDPTLEEIRVVHGSHRVEESLRSERALWTLAMVTALTAAVLAAVGIYGTLLLFVRQRRAEIAIRAALGAREATLAGLVVKECLSMTIVGSVGGAVAFVFLVGPMFSAWLYGVSATSPTALIVALVAIAMVAAAASALPARSAARVAPMEVLRND